MLLKNLIKDIPKAKKNISISGLSANSKEVKKTIFFLPLKEINTMEKNLYTKQSAMVQL